MVRFRVTALHPMPASTLLVIEDDAPIRRGIVAALGTAGHRVLESGDGDTGLELVRTAAVDLVLLDVMLPGRDGFDVLTDIRQSCRNLPVIMLTARGDESDRVRGLRRGADDYVVKPFSVKELLARVEAVLRRSPQRTESIAALHWAGLTLDLDRGEIVGATGSGIASLTAQESDLLAALSHTDAVLTREQLLDAVWGVALSGRETRVVDMAVVRLRHKLRDAAPDHDDLIQTVRGRGYRLAADATSRPSSTPKPGPA